jgi:hypothetical protein
MAEYFKKPSEVVAVFRELGSKLNKNFESALGTEQTEFNKAEIKARAFVEVGRILSDCEDITLTQKECICVFEEMFGDTICSLYFAACALDKPAQMLLRRVLELGVAVVYLWDLPHKYWGWKCHDEDLAFREMLTHLTAESYLTFASRTNSKFTDTQILDVASARKIYGELSDATHGKMATFESVSPNRYNFTTADWQRHLCLTNSVQDILLKLWANRFKGVAEQLPVVMPQLSKLT